MKKYTSAGICLLCSILVLSTVSADTKPVWNGAWKSFQEIAVQETAGIERIQEPVNCEIQFQHSIKPEVEEAIEDDVKREIRIVRYTSDGQFIEIPSQVYDIRPGRKNLKSNPPQVAIRARIAFLADVPALSTERYFAYYGNPDAKHPRYDSPLKVSGQGVMYTIENSWYTIKTEEMSGQIDQIDLNFSTKPSLRFKYGTLHWNPDFIVVPDDHPSTGYTWFYAHHFDKPR